MCNRSWQAKNYRTGRKGFTICSRLHTILSEKTVLVKASPRDRNGCYRTCLFMKEDKECDLEYSSLYDYTMSWTNRMNRGGLMVVKEHFYVLIKRIEMIVRQILKKSLIISYDGEDLRDILFKKSENN